VRKTFSHFQLNKVSCEGASLNSEVVEPPSKSTSGLRVVAKESSFSFYYFWIICEIQPGSADNSWTDADLTFNFTPSANLISHQNDYFGREARGFRDP